MSWEKFIQDNIKKSLLQEGFSESLAVGGQTKVLIYTAVCPKRHVKARCSMIV